MTETRRGVLFGLAAYGWWGFVAIYFKSVAHVAPLEVLAHRVVWSLALLVLWLALSRQLATVRPLLRDRRTVAISLVTTALIAVNWLVFIWAVSTGHLLQASLGYFINPLVNVVLGVAFLGERLRRAQSAAVALATVSVAWLIVVGGTFPWVSLALALTFGLYGLLRKKARVDSALGLAVETGVLLPLALLYIGWRMAQGDVAFGPADPRTSVLLVLAGPVTALPLLWFVAAARRLPYTTIGFLQYIAPSLQFALAVFAFGEPLRPATLAAFAGIWAALAVFSVDLWRAAGSSSRSR